MTINIPATILSMRSFSNFNVFCKHSVFLSKRRAVCKGDGRFSGLPNRASTLYSSGLISFYLLILFRIWRINNIGIRVAARLQGFCMGRYIRKIVIVYLEVQVVYIQKLT